MEFKQAGKKTEKIQIQCSSSHKTEIHECKFIKAIEGEDEDKKH